MEYVNYSIILLLSLIGIVSVIKSAVLFLCSENKLSCKIILELDDCCENPESTIRSFVMYHEWSDKSRVKYSGIYCIYNGKNEESKEICKRVCDDYSLTYYINNYNEIYDYF